MRTKYVISYVFLLTLVCLTACKKDLSNPEEFLYGKWNIKVLDTCSGEGIWDSILRDKGIFYFYKDLTCDVKYTGREPFLFGKTFYWTRENEDDFEMYNDVYIFPGIIKIVNNNEIEMYMSQKNVQNVSYHVILKRRLKQ